MKKAALDHRIQLESNDTFSAWPILFDQVDTVGLLFDAQTDLELPLADPTYLSFTFWAKEGGRANPAPATLMTLLIAVVLRWRKAKEGIWLRGGFSEPPHLPKTLPVKSIQDRLRTAMKAKRLALTYASYELSKHRTELKPLGDGSHYVKRFPLLSFALYEIPEPVYVQEEAFAAGPRLSQEQ